MKTAVPPLHQQVIVITGASSGFGKGAALKFAAAGASLVLAARRGTLLDKLVLACEAAGGKAIAVPTDVSQPRQVEKLARIACRTYGQIDTWINNAGVGAIGTLTTVPLADHLQVIATNLSGTLTGSYVALTHFRQQGHGILINVASMLGKTPAAYYASYAASKAGIIGLSTATRHELAQEKRDAIHVCTVLPMAMDTSFFDHAANYTGREAIPIPPVYSAELVVDALFALATEPQAEVIVGSAGKLAALAQKIVPELVDNVSTFVTGHTQMNQTHRQVPDTAGNLHTPSAIGTELHTDDPRKRAGKAIL